LSEGVVEPPRIAKGIINKNMAKKSKKEPRSESSKSKTMLLTDPDKADRTLTLGGRELKLEAGHEKQEVKLTTKEAKELKKNHPYLELK